MKPRLFFSPILALLLTTCAPGQPMPQGGGNALRETPNATVPRAVPEEGNAAAGSLSVADGRLSYRQALMHRIELQEAAIRKAESAGMVDAHLAWIYEQLGLLYANVAMWDKSEASLEHAISLFRHSPEENDELAIALSGLGRVHVSLGKLRESEREEEEALRLRQAKGDPLMIARSKDDLAELYLAQRKLAKAKDAARQAIDEFAGDMGADAFDKVSARYTLALALCASKDCPSAVAPLKEAIEEAKTSFEMRDFPLGIGEFLLGYAYWKSGDVVGAGTYMERGTNLMNDQLGWGHPMYLAALKHYARFLRESGRKEDAEEVERRIRRAEVVVDVRSFGTGSPSITGLR